MSFDPQDAIGFTDDGLVFIMITSNIQGRTLKTIKTWTAEEANLIAAKLIGASEKAIGKRNERNRINIDPVSA